MVFLTHMWKAPCDTMQNVMQALPPMTPQERGASGGVPWLFLLSCPPASPPGFSGHIPVTFLATPQGQGRS